MKKSIIILVISIFIGSTSAQSKWFEFGKTHIGLEYNILWGWGDSDLIVADYENWDDGPLKSLNIGFGFNSDFSIQVTCYKSFILRYTYVKLVEDFSGPIGESHYYHYGDTNSSEYDYTEVTYEYDDVSGRIKKSHIFSFGYPIKLFEFKYQGGTRWDPEKKTMEIPLILFVGVAFNNSEIMDLYVRSEHFMDWYFMSEYDWYIENRTNEYSNISLSFGISIPFFIQTSLFYTGQDIRLMLGVGI